MQASFIPYFKNKMIKPLVRVSHRSESEELPWKLWTMEDVAISEVVSDMLDARC